jgi:hypothetical protein
VQSRKKVRKYMAHSSRGGGAEGARGKWVVRGGGEGVERSLNDRFPRVRPTEDTMLITWMRFADTPCFSVSRAQISRGRLGRSRRRFRRREEKDSTNRHSWISFEKVEDTSWQGSAILGESGGRRMDERGFVGRGLSGS